jgi:hypothetical protein
LFSNIFDSARQVVMAQPVSDYLSTTLAAVLFFITYKKYFKKAAN